MAASASAAFSLITCLDCVNERTYGREKAGLRGVSSLPSPPLEVLATRCAVRGNVRCRARAELRFWQRARGNGARGGGVSGAQIKPESCGRY